MGSNRLFWFYYLYFIGSYIRIYREVFKNYKKQIKIGLTLAIITNFLAGSFFILVGYYVPIFSEKAYYLFAHGTGDKSPLTLLISVLLFLFFLEMNIKSSKIINLISSTTLGVYCIHDHYIIRTFFGDYFFNNSRYIYSPKLILYSIFAIFLTFVGCSLISFVINLLTVKPRQAIEIWVQEKLSLKGISKS